MSELRLAARSEGRNERHARIGVWQNEGKAGVLTVEAEHEAAVLAAINGHADLLAACQKIAAIEAGRAPDNATWHDVANECIKIARAAIAKAEPTTETNVRPMSPAEFANEMQAIAKIGDQEIRHGDADDLICRLLTELGYAEGVKLFDEMEKWYA